MLGRLSLVGAIVLSLSTGLLGTANVTAADSTVTSNRPSQAELQSAINQLEQLGDYQAYFGPNSSVTISNQIPHYQEYLYLHNLTASTQTLVDHYDDVAYLTQHQVTDQTFQDALTEMQHAYRGCSLIFGLHHTTEAGSTQSNQTAATRPSTSTSTPNSSNVTQVTTQNTTTTVKPTTSTKVVAGTAKSSSASISTSTTHQAAPAQVALAETSDANAAISSDNATNVNSNAHSDDTTDATDTAGTTDATISDIAVPATGEAAGTAGLTARRVSWPVLIAIVTTGAAVASGLIAIIIRHEPRRSHRARRRH